MSVTEPPEATAPAHPGVSEILRPVRGRLIQAGSLAAVGSLLTLVPLAGIAHLAQLMLGQPAASPQTGVLAETWLVIGASLVCLFAGMALMALAETRAHLADNQITGHLRQAVAERLARVPLGWFTQQASGEVKQAMQDDIDTLHSLTAHFYTTLGRASGAVLGAVVYLFAMDWRLALVALLPFPLFFLFVQRATRASAAHLPAFGAGMAHINNAVVAFVQGLPVVKAFGAEGQAHASYHGAVDAFAAAFTDFTRPLVNAMANAHALLTPVVVLAVILTAGLLFTTLGWMQPLDLLPFVLVAPGLCAPLLLLSYITHDLQNATGAAQRVGALLRTPVLETLSADSASAPQGNEIRVEQVSYRYGDAPVLEDVSFTLAPGTVTALVGPSGAGKSTLARLLLRFFDPNAGRITLGGADLRTLDSTQLYRQIGFVLQDVRLIDASLRDNIALGRPTATQDEIEAAARTANIHERILALPRGYDSVIGEDAHLSGGELQRVSIARAVLLDPPVLVLDEATAAADAENEVQIQSALSRFAKDRTVLVIAHRLDTVMHADQILVLADGHIEERGTHAQLLARQGRYARLWTLGDESQTRQEAPSPC